MTTEPVLGRADDLLQRLPSAIESVRARAIGAGLKRGVIDPLAARVRDRVKECAR